METIPQIQELRKLFFSIDKLCQSVEVDLFNKKIEAKQADQFFSILEKQTIDTLVISYVSLADPLVDKIARTEYINTIINHFNGKVNTFYKMFGQKTFENLFSLSEESIEEIEKIVEKFSKGLPPSKEDFEFFKKIAGLSDTTLNKAVDSKELDKLEELDKVSLKDKFSDLLAEINDIANKHNENGN